MSRISYSYSDDEDFPGQFGLWQANCNRQIASKRGQATLRELREALLAMPSKRLIAKTMAQNGEVCTVGALLAYRRVKNGETFEQASSALRAEVVEREDFGDGDVYEHDELDTADVAEKHGVPNLVAWKLVVLNDIQIESHYKHHDPTPEYPHGRSERIEFTPEERYVKVLAWVNERLSRQAAR